MKKKISLNLNFTRDINISLQGSGKNNAMDWTVFPGNSYIEVLTPIVIVFGEGGLWEAILEDFLYALFYMVIQN